jgi:hypothetical protein
MDSGAPDSSAIERPMTGFSVTDIVLEGLVGEWQARLPRLAEHLKTEFGYVVTHPLAIKRLFICEQADGTVVPENIGGMVRRKWVVQDECVREVPLDFAWKEMYDTDDSGIIYVSLSFLFCCQDDLILLSERYAAELRHRLRGQIIRRGPKPGIEWKTLWKCVWNPEGRDTDSVSKSKGT